MMAFTLVAQEPDIARAGHWSVRALRLHAPADQDEGAMALAGVLLACAGGTLVAVRRGLALRRAYASCRDLPGGTGELVVVGDPDAIPCAVPGRPGRIVVSRSLLATLTASQRRALLAHERAHLRHGHHWHVSAVAFAAGVLPLLVPLRPAIEQAVERWADEEAAAVVGDRRVAAAALARAALFISGHGRPAVPLLLAGGGALPLRVAALLEAPPRPRPALVLVALLVLLTGIAGTVVAAKETEHLFELAMRAYGTTQSR
jgi:hypothetical protein